MSEAVDTSTPLWKSPWTWAFVFGLIVLPWFRPIFSRVAPPPPDLGAAPSDTMVQGGVTLSVWCGEPGVCTSAEAKAVWKTSFLLVQAGMDVDWRVYRTSEDKFGRQLQRWCAERAGSCVDASASAEAGDVLGAALRTQQTVRHALVNTAVELAGSVSLVDASTRVRGVFRASDAEARREITHRVEALLRESREAGK
jgi:hypothetical protein